MQKHSNLITIIQYYINFNYQCHKFLKLRTLISFGICSLCGSLLREVVAFEGSLLCHFDTTELFYEIKDKNNA